MVALGRSAGAPWAVLAGLVAVTLLLTARLGTTGDDAFIIYAYARRLAEGHGLVWFPGQRVEGYTCLLWVVVLGLCRLAGFDLEASGAVLGAATGAAALPLAYGIARRLGASPWVALVAPALLAASPSMAYWASSGMDAVPVAAAMALAACVYVARPDSLAVPVLLAVAVLVRPDAAVLAGCVATERSLALRRSRRLLAWIATLGVPLLAVECWRLAYYGHPLPNTFYAKVGASSGQVASGLAYAAAFLGSGGWAGMLVPVAAGIAGSTRRRLAATVGAAVALHAVHVVLVGGDFMLLHRFFVPVLPLACALAAVGLARAMAHGRATTASALKVACLLGLGLLAWGSVRGFTLARDRRGLEQAFFGYEKARARSLVPLCKDGTRIAAVGVGILGYATDCQVIDMVGLVDEHIAHRPMPAAPGLAGHAKHDTAYVLDRRPELILIPRDGLGSLLPPVRAMLDDQRFQREYVWDGSVSGFRRKP